jgi:hypothetical protein
MVASHRRPELWAAVAALVLAAVPSLLLAFLPVYSSESATATSGGAVSTSSGRATLLDVNGPGVLVVLLVPVALATLGLIGSARRRRVLIWVAGGLLLGFALVSGLSIGLFYLPAAVALLLSAWPGQR